MEPGHDDLWTALHATMRALSRLERKVIALEAQIIPLQALVGATPAEVSLSTRRGRIDEALGEENR